MDGMDSTNALQSDRRTPQTPLSGMDRWLIQAWLAPAAQKTLREARKRGPCKRPRKTLLAEGSYFRRIAEAVPVPVFYTDARGQCVYVNPQWSVLTGLPRYEAYGEGWSRAIHPEERERMLRNWQRLVPLGEPFHDECRYQRPDGTALWIASQCVPVYDKTPLALAGYVGTLTDITEQKRTQDMRGEGQASLARQLLKAQEDERLRIARELHDEMGQVLTALKIELQEILREPILPRTRLHDSIGMVDHIMGQVRTLLADLRPAPLETLGLPAALRWYLERQVQRSGLAIEFHADALLRRLPMEVEIGCFRIVQEALTNAIKHARAQRITIALRQEGTSIHLWIKDNGIGFDVSAAQERAAAGGSCGLLGMQERAHLAGGHLDIESIAREGTQIRVQFPLVAH